MDAQTRKITQIIVYLNPAKKPDTMSLLHKLSRPLIPLAGLFSICTSLHGQNQSLEQNKALAKSYLTEVVNQHKLSLLPEIYSPAFVFHEMNGEDRHTIADSSLLAFLNYLFKAFPDLHYTIDNTVAENDLVALNCTAKGTQKGEFLGFPPSNRVIVFKEMFFFRILDHKIAEGWGVVDKDGVVQQISKK